MMVQHNTGLTILARWGQADSPFKDDYNCEHQDDSYRSSWDRIPKLTSLEGAPAIVYGTFTCANNSLTSLQHGPIEVTSDYYCGGNRFTTLVGAPKTVGEHIVFDCSSNKLLTSLTGIPSHLGMLYCQDCNLTSLKGIHYHIKEMYGHANFDHNPIRSHVLGLLKIKGLQFVILKNKKVQGIVNDKLDYLAMHADSDDTILEVMDACIEELEDAGLGDYAQL